MPRQRIVSLPQQQAPAKAWAALSGPGDAARIGAAQRSESARMPLPGPLLATSRPESSRMVDTMSTVE